MMSRFPSQDRRLLEVRAKLPARARETVTTPRVVAIASKFIILGTLTTYVMLGNVLTVEVGVLSIRVSSATGELNVISAPAEL